jgi:precorrin-2 dehydrogenase/sirohydrochlorin ferrochelatase
MDLPLEYYSLLIDLQEKNVVVIGQYRILEFKIQKLIDAGAKIRYISDTLSPNLKQYVESGQITYVNEKYNEKHLEDAWLVICGSDDSDLKKRIQQATTQRHLFCNFVDETIPSSFISPSVITKGDIIISISTKGKSPALNKLLKKKINEFVGEEYQKFAELMGKIRSMILNNISNQKDRAELFDSIVQNQVIFNLLKQNKTSEAEKIVNQIVNESLKNK